MQWISFYYVHGMGDKSLAYFLGDLNFLKRGRGMALNFAQLIPGAVCQRVEQASS